MTSAQFRPAADPVGKRSPPIVWVLSAGLVGLLLRLPGLLQSLWVDEVFRTLVYLQGERARQLIFFDVHNPLYNIFMFAWVRVFGDSEIAIRLPSLAAALALIALVWHWTARRLGRSAAHFAALFLLVCPVHVWYSTEAKNNIFTVLWTTAAAMALDSAMRARTLRPTLAAAVFAVLAVLTDAQSLLVLVPCCVLAAWMALRDARPGRLTWGDLTPSPAARLMPILGLLLAVAAVMVPWAIFKSGHASGLTRTYVGYFHWHEAIRLLFVWLPTGNALPPFPAERPGGWLAPVQEGWVLRALLVAPFILPPLVRGVLALRRSPSGMLALGAILWPLVLMLVLSDLLVLFDVKLRLYQPRNLLVIMPWFAIVLGAGLAAIPPGPWRWPRALAPLALALASTILMRTTEADRATVITPNPDWRSACLWITAERPAPLPVIANTMLLPVEYYAPGRPLRELPRAAPLAEELGAIAAREPSPEFWYVENPFWGRPIDPAERAAALGAYDTLAQRDFRSLRVVLLRRR